MDPEPMPPDGRDDDPNAPAARTRIVLLAGPSGSGKTSLAEHVGLPTVSLDDFYKDADDTTLPEGLLPGPDGRQVVDWDHPDSWHAHRALAALVELALTGSVELPVYDIPTSRSTGTHRIDVGDAPLVIAEGIFAAELIDGCRDADILADALCLTLRPTVTFWRRLVRDLRESRKPPATLVRRGVALLRAEPAVVARQISLGAAPVDPAGAARRLRRLIDQTATRGRGGLAA